MASGPCPYCGGDVSVQNTAAQLQVGTVLSGHKVSYLVGKAIGSGGFGQTYLAYDLSHNRRVAIKEYYPKRCNPQRDRAGNVRTTVSHETVYNDGMKSFLTEATMLQALNDVKGIVNVYDYFRAFGTAYMVMEYVVGETLRLAVERRGAMGAEQLLSPMLHLMRDIAAVNDAGVVHRDINPQNIIVMPTGDLRLIDFGCARSIEDGKSMEVLLTPGFAPPEQYGRRGQGPYTDVYGLCATIYYCLTATIPPDSNERLSAVHNGREDPIVKPSMMRVYLPTGVETVLMRGLAIKKDDRFQTMDELADAMSPLVTSEKIPLTVRPANMPTGMKLNTTKESRSGKTGRHPTTRQDGQNAGLWSTTADMLRKMGQGKTTGQKQASTQRQVPQQKQQPPQRQVQPQRQASQQKPTHNRSVSPVKKRGMSDQDQLTTIILIVLVVLSAIGVIAIIVSMQPSSTSGSVGSTTTESSETYEPVVYGGDSAGTTGSSGGDAGNSSQDAQVTHTQTSTNSEVSRGRKVKPGDRDGVSIPV